MLPCVHDGDGRSRRFLIDLSTAGDLWESIANGAMCVSCSSWIVWARHASLVQIQRLACDQFLDAEPLGPSTFPSPEFPDHALNRRVLCRIPLALGLFHLRLALFLHD